MRAHLVLKRGPLPTRRPDVVGIFPSLRPAVLHPYLVTFRKRGGSPISEPFWPALKVYFQLAKRRALRLSSCSPRQVLRKDTVQLGGLIRVWPRIEHSSYRGFCELIRRRPPRWGQFDGDMGHLHHRICCACFSSFCSGCLRWGGWCCLSLFADGWQWLCGSCPFAFWCSSWGKWYLFSGCYSLVIALALWLF